jgi:hypothetical protein
VPVIWHWVFPDLGIAGVIMAGTSEETLRGNDWSYMPIRTTLSCAATLFLASLINAETRGAAPIVPLPNAHAHNDYWHGRPLLDALDHGFTSVEADVSPIDGDLLVGHETSALKAGRTLESLYLAPLAERARANGGHIYPNGGRFFLLIDIKRDPQQSYRLLQALFSKYQQILAVVENGNVRNGAVTVVLTGDRPKIDPRNSGPRYAGLDGRLTDVDSHAPAHFMPMISDNWAIHFQWTGNGPMPAAEQAKLQEIVKKAHAAGRVVRFWNTPEKETVWRTLRAAGVDLINTDQLDRLAAFLRASDVKASRQ